MAWPVVGKAFTPAEFAAYVRGLRWDGAFRPLFVALHNTAVPSLAQRPAGLTRQHILNLQTYYRQEKGWKGGPHLFVDDRQIWVFNDLTKFGTHSPSWNGTAIGIEMLGDYECESFTEGRGRKVRDNTVAAMAALNNRLGFAADAFRFHIEDRKSDHACPGRLARAERAQLAAEIAAAMAPPAALPEDVEVAAADEPLMIQAADPPAEKVGWRERAQVLQETIDLGSRLGTSIRGGINAVYALLVATGLVGTGTVALVDTTKGTAAVASETLRPFPVLLVAVLAFMAGVTVVGAVAWWYFRRAGNGLVTAVRAERYLPPKQPTQQTVEA